MVRASLRLFFVALLSLTVLSCSKAAPTVTAIFKDPAGKTLGSFYVEIAATAEERAKGLMFRKEMAENAGMIFIFPEARQLRFWMKNTYIPLDMVFIGEDLKVIGVVEKAAPMTEDPRIITGPAKYVVELGGGVAKKFGIGAGSIMSITGELPRPL